MLLLSLGAIACCLIAFIADAQVPFLLPISLLGDAQHLWAYRLVLLSFTVVAAWFLWLRARVGDIHDLVFGGVMAILLVSLQFVPNEKSGHDGLASTLMVVTSMLSLGIAQRLGDARLLLMTIGSLVTCSMLFSHSLMVLGLVEGAVLVTAIVAMNAACRAPERCTWSWQSSSTAVVSATQTSAQFASQAFDRATWWWRPGMGSGMCWGLFCLLISGISGIFPHGGVVAGPVVLIACSGLGYLAWREEVSFWLRAPLVFGGYALVVFLLSTVDATTLHLHTVVPIVVVMGMVMVVMLIVDLYTS